MTEQPIIVKPHWRAYGVWYLAIILFVLGPGQNPEAPISTFQGLAVAAFITACITFHALTSRLEINSVALTKKGGLISRGIKTMDLDQLKEVKLQRGLIHAALGVGVLVFVPKSADGELIKFWGATSPKSIKSRVEKLAGLTDEG